MSHPKTGKVKIREADAIALHWFNAFIWLTMLASGFGLISGDYVRVVPAAWAEAAQSLFGGADLLILTHAIIGIIWGGVFLLYTIFYFDKVFSFLRQVMIITPWTALKFAREMLITLLQLFGLARSVKLPPAGRFNGAQRLLGTMIIMSSIALFATGLYLFFSPKVFSFYETPIYGAIFRWSLTIHIIAVFLVLIGLVAHIYFAVIEERESLEAMSSGYIDEEFLKHHNPGFYEEIDRSEKP